MIDHEDPDKKPFKVGQLVRRFPKTTYLHLYLIVDIRWVKGAFPLRDHWQLRVLSQQSGLRSLSPAKDFELAVKNK